MKTPMQLIYCPGPDKWLTLGQYVQVVKRAKENPKQEFKTGITTWWPVTGKEIYRQYLKGLHDRISQGVSYSKRGL